MTVHVIGAGLAGLSAAVALAGRGVRVVVSEAAKQAGGRCRSYHDSLLDMTIDNGNHLVLSGNGAVDRYLRDIGARDRLTGPGRAEFHFMDFQLGRRWTLRPDDGPVPWWIFDAARRVPGTYVRDYLVLLTLMRRHPGRRIGEIVRRDTVLWEKFLRPVLLSALNTAPEEASADLAGAIVRETLAKGGRHMEPLVASPISPPPSSIRQSIGCAAPARTSGWAARCAPSGSPTDGRSGWPSTRETRRWARRTAWSWRCRPGPPRNCCRARTHRIHSAPS